MEIQRRKLQLSSWRNLNKLKEKKIEFSNLKKLLFDNFKTTWGVPINVKIGFDCEICCMMNNSKEVNQKQKISC